MDDPRDRLIVALDVPEPDAALALVEKLGDAVTFYKVGLELFYAPGGGSVALALASAGKRVMLDVKLHDIPATVGKAAERLARFAPRYLTVHAEPMIVAAAVRALPIGIGVLAVTVLTHLSSTDLAISGVDLTPEQAVLRRARYAIGEGAEGVVASGREALALRTQVGTNFRVATPGIRGPGEDAQDQARTMAADEAIKAGADHVIVGRPIRNAADPRAEALKLQRMIASAGGALT